MIKEIECSTGAVLKIYPAPFKDANNLYKAILREIKGVPLSKDVELGSLFKDFFCGGFSSMEIERCLWECMKRCTYNNGKGDLKIDSDTFEPVEAREDYMKVCIEVAKENVFPFLKSLYAEYKQFLAMTENRPA